ncbi:hypothetical protein [Nocardioides yefusunii]|uniref:DUF4129 domain-containing protein n=1 Tax=Nocardioides yefusunii TaxID=2500546 RepID=A0ABW1QS40_9ACTN|nr:hypothetical protein [Nocardioides yefusunii]
MDVVDVLRASGTALNPPAGYSAWWWITVALAVLALLALGWRTRLVLRGARDSAPAGGLESLRALTTQALDAIRDQEPDPRRAVQEMSAQVRRFVGVVSDGDADYTTLPALRCAAVKDPRLDAVVTFLEHVRPGLFDGRSPLDVDDVHRRAREVVQRWV